VRDGYLTYDYDPGHVVFGSMLNPGNRSEAIMSFQDDFEPEHGSKLTKEQYLVKEAEWLALRGALPAGPEVA